MAVYFSYKVIVKREAKLIMHINNFTLYLLTAMKLLSLNNQAL